jgi:heliorhodopsin
MIRPTDAIDPGGLRLINLTFGLAHLAQAVLFIALAEDVRFDVSATFASGPPGEPVTPDRLDVLFSYPLAPAVAAFSLLSAGFHLLIASPWGWPRYLDELARQQNRFRWVEYSVSASLMIVLIAGVTGITDIAALLALFGVNASMILFGWLMETHNEPGDDVDWSPFVFGCIAGAVPWIAIGWYLFGAGSAVPNFVYGIFVSIFVFFNCFAINQMLQYRRIGRWADYLAGERTYVWLSLIAKSALAWQIFANVLTA